MGRKLRPEQAHPGECGADHALRVRPWSSMMGAATEVKTVRSRMTTALESLRDDLGCIDDPDPEGWYVVPPSQRDRLSEWIQVLSRQLVELESIDLEGWKPEVRGEIAFPEA